MADDIVLVRPIGETPSGYITVMDCANNSELRSFQVPPGRRRAITAGEFCLDRAPAVLETFLGSCVGIALYDPETRVGGLLHVVLPSGLARKEAENPAVFASSGIPFLVKAMVEAGASQGRLRASIAGGAHIRNQVNSPDLKIGMRNIVAARAALQSDSIPIVMEEVGEDFGRYMRLNLVDGQVEIRASRPFAEAASADFAAEKRMLLSPQLLTETIDNLKPVSDVALKSLEMARDPASNYYQLERLILQDQVLAANVLRLVNSSYYGLTSRVTIISQALALLGMVNFRRLVMQAVAHHFFARKLFAYSMEEGALFHHSVICARLAELLLPDGGAAVREEAYLAGLFHDLGKVVFERCASAAFPRVMDRVLVKHETFHQAERDILGLDHGEVGKLLADLWGLPSVFGESIALHHQPASANRGKKIVCVVHVADILCNMLGVGPGADSLANDLDPEALRVLNLNEKALDEILSEMPRILSQYV